MTSEYLTSEAMLAEMERLYAPHMVEESMHRTARWAEWYDDGEPVG